MLTICSLVSEKFREAYDGEVSWRGGGKYLIVMPLLTLTLTLRYFTIPSILPETGGLDKKEEDPDRISHNPNAI